MDSPQKSIKPSKSKSSKSSQLSCHKKKSKKRRQRSSSSSSSSTTSTSSEEKRRRMRKKAKKALKKKEKKLKRKKHEEEASADVPLHLMEPNKKMAPMTKEEWDKRQSVVRKVYDEASGRTRLIKGDGEVIEEVVSRERHSAINRQATKGDGEYFQAQLNLNKKQCSK